MAKYTNNYNFKKPEQEDFYNVDDQNENMDIIDEALKEIEEKQVYVQEEEPIKLKPNTLWFAVNGEVNFSEGGVSIENAEIGDIPPQTDNIWFKPI